MARRNDHSREELYQLALGAARDIAEAEGLRGLTARRIAAEIGYSVGTLYNVFVNLDDLIIHLNGSTLDQLYKALSQGSRSGAVLLALLLVPAGLPGRAAAQSPTAGEATAAMAAWTL